MKGDLNLAAVIFRLMLCNKLMLKPHKPASNQWYLMFNIQCTYIVYRMLTMGTLPF